MIKLGEKQKLIVMRYTEFGVFLNISEEEDKTNRNSILLPANQVEEGLSVGDEIEVFVYRDSEDRLIATTKKVYISLDEIALLKVSQVVKFGAFLDWGLERDLFLPFKEQIGRVKEGDKCLVALYIDKSDRLCATMRITKYLRDDSPYKPGDMVNGTLYSINDEMGAFVAIDNLFHGMIHKNELYGNFKCGDKIEARVLSIRDDGKLELSVRKPAYLQMDDDSELIFKRLEEKGGNLPLNDKSKPEDIKKEFPQMSKNGFKRAIGRLMKEKKIVQTKNGIKIQ